MSDDDKREESEAKNGQLITGESAPPTRGANRPAKNARPAPLHALHLAVSQ